MNDYKKTLNLPVTDFPMRANLPQREPEFLALWEKEDLYNTLLYKNKDKKKFVFHDGPPYANGDIHLGHALNKTLKDILVRYKFMSGYHVPFIPGWDCHGLPVEHQLFKQLGLKKTDVNVLDFRKKARNYALKYVDIQRKQFKRLGLYGSWEKPYLTLDKEYEVSILKSLYFLAKKGYLYKDVKPVNWCIECETALAEAEVEYEDHVSDSIYVKFKVSKDSKLRKKNNLPPNTYFLIWTTTPWTLISNVAIAVAPDEDYVFILDTDTGDVLIIAEKLKSSLISKNKLIFGAEILKLKGYELEGEIAEHPFLDRNSTVLSAGFVSMEEGSGCVHIAPGHGQEDYLLGREKNLEIVMPLNDKGFFENAGEFSGMLVWDANNRVKDVLKSKKALLKEDKISHSYPHCWRCKSPIVFRATMQWFMSVDKNQLRVSLLRAVDSILWIPKTGLQRIKGMLETRPDWCLSRQRLWGVAIPALRCKCCGDSILDTNVILKVIDVVKIEGSDAWFKEDYKRFLSQGFSCSKCGNFDLDNFEKEHDIIDVWFESGVSHQAVLREENSLSYPADLYMEGSDQHRGWFQTSLITGLAIEGVPPYKAALTHGFVVDGEGRKMSKSLGNVISPFDIINKYGADVLRAWVISRDFSQDLRISNEILLQVVEAYRKIRNTFRFLLSNLYDYNPKEAVLYADLDCIDKWIYNELNKLIREINSSYENYDFSNVFRKLYLFMNETLSSLYLDILKDRLYTFHPQDKKRVSSQAAIYRLASTLAKIIAPVFPFTAEDVWQHLKNKNEKDSEFESVHFAAIDIKDYAENDVSIDEDFMLLFQVRDIVMKVLEAKREKAVIGSSLEAKVILKIKVDKLYNFLHNYNPILNALFIVSEVVIEKINNAENLANQLNDTNELGVEVEKSKGIKCARCWNYKYDVGSVEEYKDVCERCAKVLKGII